MQIDFLSVFFTVLSLVILLIPGFIVVKAKILWEKADKVLSALTLYVAQPALVFMSFQKEYSSKIAINMLIVAGISIFIHLVMIGLVCLFIRNKKGEEKKNAKKDVVRFASVFSNCGYMGIPFIKSLFNESEMLGEILIYVAVVMAIFNIFTWTFGTYFYSHDKKCMSFKKIALNPVIISIVLGFLYFIVAKKPFVSIADGNKYLDEFLTKLSNSLDAIANMVTPLAMFIIGMKIANAKPKQLFIDKWAYISSFNKLIIMSFVCILSVAFLPIAVEIKYAIFFALSMPSASNTTLFAVTFGGDSETASISVLLSTVLSIFSVAVMFLLFKLFLGV